MKPILPGVFQITRPPGVNMYLIDDPGGLTLIDTSLASAVQGVLADLRRMGRQPSDLRRILITHAHPDHVGGLPELKRITGAEVIVPQIERPAVEGKVPVPRPAAGFRMPEMWLKPAPVDRTVGDEDTLDVLGGLVAVFTPGHSPGHMAYWQPERRLLFCGDALFNVVGLSLPPAFLTVDVAENRRSVAKIAALEPEIVCFGHGPVLRGAAMKLHAFAGKVAPPAGLMRGAGGVGPHPRPLLKGPVAHCRF